MAIITYSDALLQDLNINTSTQQAKATAIINMSQSAMERYCRRKFDYGQYDKQFDIINGRIYIDAYPVNRVTRVMVSKLDAIQIKCTNLPSSWSTSTTALYLNSYINGVAQTEIELDYTTYTTIQSLVNQINLQTGWSAIVLNNYGSWTSSDIYAGLRGGGDTTNGQDATNIPIWTTISAINQFDLERAMGYIYLGNLWMTEGITPGSGYGGDLNLSGDQVPLDFSFGFFNLFQPRSFFADSFQRARVVWYGGYGSSPAQPYPEDLAQVCALLVKGYWDDKSLLVNEETLKSATGEQRYRTANVNLDRLPITTLKMLSFYRRRLI